MEYQKNLCRISDKNQAKINLNRTLHLRFIYGPSTVHLRFILENDTFYKPYKGRNALYPAFPIFSGIERDLRIRDVAIIVTGYNAQRELNLQLNYQYLQQIMTKKT